MRRLCLPGGGSTGQPIMKSNARSRNHTHLHANTPARAQKTFTHTRMENLACLGKDRWYWKWKGGRDPDRKMGNWNWNWNWNWEMEMEMEMEGGHYMDEESAKLPDDCRQTNTPLEWMSSPHSRCNSCVCRHCRAVTTFLLPQMTRSELPS